LSSVVLPDPERPNSTVTPASLSNFAERAKVPRLSAMSASTLIRGFA
jgi:hypothetical protein